MIEAENLKQELGPGWQRALGDEFQQDYMRSLFGFLRQEEAVGKVIYPPAKDRFNALKLTPLERVEVVILGQDPYHGPGQAHGLCFSVKPGVRPPPSLVNIYKELASDLGVEPVDHGYLGAWALQGVLLLNSVLTVEQGRAASHQGLGWERFTDRIIHLLSEERQGLVFLLWGSYAQKKGAFIDRHRHRVLEAPHPSPLSARRGFFGCRHFSQTNAYLVGQGKAPIDWQLPRQEPRQP